MNRRAAEAVVWQTRIDDDTPAPDARDLLEALGLVDGAQVITDSEQPKRRPEDATTPRMRPSEPKPANMTTPPGLRNLAPAAAPTPVKKAAPRRGLQAELDELERTDPDVAAAAQSYDDMVRRVTSRPLPAAAVPRPAKKRGGRPLQPIAHGSEKGFKQHRTHGVPVPDDDACGCRAAANAAWRDRSAARRVRKAAEVDHTQQKLAVAVELDTWFAEAQRSPAPGVQRAARAAVSALLQLRIAMDDLARAERTAAARLAGVAQ